eukprot:8396-Eustigmatos_ZCMA.PRE.1
MARVKHMDQRCLLLPPLRVPHIGMCPCLCQHQLSPHAAPQEEHTCVEVLMVVADDDVIPR